MRYDRSTGYFSAYALALAARGIEGLVHNGGRMRLVVGCTLKPQDLAAIQQGAELRDTVEAAFLTEPLGAADPAAIDALALLAWMVAKARLDAKAAVPCDEEPLCTKGRTWRGRSVRTAATTLARFARQVSAVQA